MKKVNNVSSKKAENDKKKKNSMTFCGKEDGKEATNEKVRGICGEPRWVMAKKSRGPEHFWRVRRADTDGSTFHFGVEKCAGYSMEYFGKSCARRNKSKRPSKRNSMEILASRYNARLL